MDLSYDIQSVSSNDSEGLTVIEQKETDVARSCDSKLTRSREPACKSDNKASSSGSVVPSASGNTGFSETVGKTEIAFTSETLSVVIERSDNSDNSINTTDNSETSASQLEGKKQGDTAEASRKEKKAPSDKHSGIVLSPLQLGQ